MIRRRTRDRGSFRGANIELMIYVVIIAIVAAIAIPSFFRYFDSKGPKCAENLLTLLDKPLPPETVCPKCSKPYAIGVRDGREFVACPAPEKHLDTNPQFVRAKGGEWTLRQTLPPYSGGIIEFAKGKTVVVQSPGRASLHVLPAGYYRYFFGPVIFGILSIASLAFLVELGAKIREKDGEAIIGGTLAVALFVSLAYFLLGDFTSSHEFVLERKGSRVRRVEYRFGSRSAETEYRNCLGFLPTTGFNARPAKFLLLHLPDAQGKRITEIDPIAGDRLDLAAWFNQAIQDP